MEYRSRAAITGNDQALILQISHIKEGKRLKEGGGGGGRGTHNYLTIRFRADDRINYHLSHRN